MKHHTGTAMAPPGSLCACHPHPVSSQAWARWAESVSAQGFPRGYTLPSSPNCVSGKDGTWQSQSHLASPLEMGTAQWVLSSMLCTYKRSTGCGPQEYPLSRAGRWVQHLVSAFPSQWERNVKLKTSHGLTGFFFNLNFPITVNN